MAARLILETDVIDVTCPPVLIYGDPGSGKTSLGFTADDALGLDFDGGSHRSAFRKKTLRFDCWDDVITTQNEGVKDAKGNLVIPTNFGNHNIILDTVDTLLKFMGQALMAGNAKLGNRAGGLSQNGWGV